MALCAEHAETLQPLTPIAKLIADGETIGPVDADAAEYLKWLEEEVKAEKQLQTIFPNEP